MDRGNRYEAAFEAYLQERRLCYVAVHEGRRTFVGESRVKNLDFIVHGESGLGLLVDVKGRRYQAGKSGKPRRAWQCWSTQDDIDGLERWQEVFGDGYSGLLVFVYLLGDDDTPPQEFGDVFSWRGHRYLMRAVTVEDYRRHLRIRSPRWQTVHLSSDHFRAVARPFRYFTNEFQASADDCPF
jgi:hypothetical protein